MELKVGDIIYRQRRGELSRDVIVRLTPKTAISKKGYKFKIEYVENSWLNKIGMDAYSGIFYAANPELDKKYKLQQIILNTSYLCQTIDFELISLEDLTTINQILIKYKKS